MMRGLYLLPVLFATVALWMQARGQGSQPAGDSVLHSNTMPAAPDGSGFGFSPKASQEKSLSQINRRVALEAGDLIKAHKFTEAKAFLDEAEKELRLITTSAHLELWDSTVAPIMRMIDARRIEILTGQSESTQPSEVKVPATPRMTPDQNRALSTIKADLSVAGIQIRTGKLTEAERTMRSVQSRLRALSGNVRVPIWSIPMATAFQVADARRRELKARQFEERAARERAAALTQPASAPASQPDSRPATPN